MNKLDDKLQEIKQRKNIGLMAHVVIGYPSMIETVSIVKTMAESGVDIVELQIPFSDPLADGPTIMKACERSLANGTKVKDAFTIMKTLSSQVSIPLLFMAYFNTVFVYGVEKFCRDAKAAGAAGLIVPDMPLDEESEERFYFYCKKYNLYTIQVLSPASTENRLQKNAVVANGFVYCTARQGTTGAKDQLDPKLGSYLQKMRKYFSVPIAVGFGIFKKEHLKILESNADIAVIGSAVIDLINDSPREKRQENLRRFFKELMVQ
ncbi:tryptophan synthase subunit alpha [Candidatus Roizmanbacteria bacterium]|nr:tryptophan synthase subunit alpha [Candidatus Roizmanbacteria bacterium]